MSRLSGKVGVTPCHCVKSQHSSSAASGVNRNQIFNCSGELTHVVGSNGQQEQGRLLINPGSLLGNQSGALIKQRAVGTEVGVTSPGTLSVPRVVCVL